MLLSRKSVRVLFVLAVSGGASRLQPLDRKRDHQRRSEKNGSNGINVLDLLSGNYPGFAIGLAGSMGSAGVVEIVQLDRATAENGGTRAFAFNSGERQGFITGWFRTAYGLGQSTPIRYGGALKVAVGEAGIVEVANRYVMHSTDGAVQAQLMPGTFGAHGMSAGQRINYFPDKVICKESFAPLVLGRRYAYIGGCRFIDVTPDNVPNTLALLPAVCESLEEGGFRDCASFFLCALDELKFTPNPAPDLFGRQIHGQSSSVAPRKTCSLTGTRPGLHHALETCFDPENAQQSHCKSQGTCSYCGEQGLCCQHPGDPWLGGMLWYNQDHEKDGCGNKGCFGRFCCVDADSQVEDHAEAIEEATLSASEGMAD